MLTWEEDVEVSALHHRGWTISAIARHLGRSRNTIRAYVRGEAAGRAPAVGPGPAGAVPGVRDRAAAGGSARLGDRALGRGTPAGVCGGVLELHGGAAPAPAAAAL